MFVPENKTNNQATFQQTNRHWNLSPINARADCMDQQLKKKSASTPLNIVLASAHTQMT
jgi:hypothetical protein